MYDTFNYHNNTVEYVFTKHLLAREGSLIQLGTSWLIELDALPDVERGAKIVYKRQSKSSYNVIYTKGVQLIWIAIDSTNVHARVVADSDSACEKAIERLKKIYPPIEVAGDGKISVNFWFNSTNGPRSIHRKIDAPPWEEVDNNYERMTKGALEKLILEFVPSHGGQIVLWHGIPGTGKTYALRALCQQWKEWCNIEYIMDPEILLSDVNYLNSVILDEDSDNHYWSEEEQTFVPEDQKWKLLIMEDTGELIAENAKDRTGQGLSRLLNITDGFIGQGLKVIVLITTNEKMERLHPAVSRPGRCAAAIGFNSLSREDAEDWLEANTTTSEALRKSSYTISDLYAIKEKFGDVVVPLKPSKFGFDLEANKVAI